MCVDAAKVSSIESLNYSVGCCFKNSRWDKSVKKDAVQLFDKFKVSSRATATRKGVCWGNRGVPKDTATSMECSSDSLLFEVSRRYRTTWKIGFTGGASVTSSSGLALNYLAGWNLCPVLAMIFCQDFRGQFICRADCVFLCGRAFCLTSVPAWRELRGTAKFHTYVLYPVKLRVAQICWRYFFAGQTVLVL